LSWNQKDLSGKQNSCVNKGKLFLTFNYFIFIILNAKVSLISELPFSSFVKGDIKLIDQESFLSFRPKGV